MATSSEMIRVSDDLLMIKPASSKWPESCNVFVLKDKEGLSLVDAGCGATNSIERLFSAINTLGPQADHLDKIILSHAHPDHVGAMRVLLEEVSPAQVILHELDLPYALDPSLLNESFDIPLCKEHDATSRTEEKAETGAGSPNSMGKKGPAFDLLTYFRDLGCGMVPVKPDRTVKEGQVITVGNSELRVYHTPGHAPGHMSLYDAAGRTLFAGDILGDMVAWYTPSSGGAAGYVESLRKMKALDIDLILPSHGKPMTDAKKSIQEFIDRIIERDHAVLHFLEDGPKTFGELNERLFEPPGVRFFPGTPILMSHLMKLQDEGKLVFDEAAGKYVSIV